MTYATIVSLAAALSGWFSAYFWYKSSQVSFSAKTTSISMGGKTPVVKEDIEEFMSITSRRNKIAALSSGLTALLSGIAVTLATYKL